MRGPVTITSDRMETFDDGSQVIFSGAVRAIQGDVTVDSDILRVYYLQGAGRSGGSLGGGIEKIVAEGDVLIRNETSVMTGDHAILHYENQTIVMTGDRASLKDGENVVEGGRITWFLAEGRGIVDDLKGGRVTATIQPDTETQGE
ncbi:MAG: LptA/OstA family protein [Syntrophales bacterium]|nr:LptA/OstA family protein [Syntrophales bacterium]